MNEGKALREASIGKLCEKNKLNIVVALLAIAEHHMASSFVSRKKTVELSLNEDLDAELERYAKILKISEDAVISACLRLQVAGWKINE